jgi:hypothetical protein
MTVNKMEVRHRVEGIMSLVKQISAQRDKLKQEDASISEKLKDQSISSAGRRHLHAHWLCLREAEASCDRTINNYISAAKNISESLRTHGHQQQVEGDVTFLSH